MLKGIAVRAVLPKHDCLSAMLKSGSQSDSIPACVPTCPCAPLLCLEDSVLGEMQHQSPPAASTAHEG